MAQPNYAAALTPAEIDRFWEKVIPEPMSGCWLWIAAVQRRGYGHVGIRRFKRYLSAHRLSWEMKHGIIPNGLWVLHKCDTPPCVNPDHLFLGTPADNMRDMANKGRHAAPSAAFLAAPRPRKLTERQASDMVAEYLRTGRRAVARKYGIVPDGVGRYVRWAGANVLHPGRNRFEPGEKHPNAILTEERVRQIRAALAAGRSARAVAKTQGVSRSLIDLIRDRKLWTHI